MEKKDSKEEKIYKKTFVDKFFEMHAAACDRHMKDGKDKGIYAVVRWLVNHEEVIVYLVVGVLTTIVALGCKFLFNYFVYDNAGYHNSVQTFILAVVNWTSGVIFAFFANRIYVFKSHGPMLPEAGKFVLSRISTFAADWLIMFVLDTKLGINVWIATAVSVVVVTVANYVMSKLLVFKKK